MAKLAAPGGIMDVFNLPRSNGVKIPRLGFGTYQIPPGRDTEAAVSVALREGYRHIDTAALYGNERDVGKRLLHIDCYSFCGLASSLAEYAEGVLRGCMCGLLELNMHATFACTVFLAMWSCFLGSLFACDR
jgi:hypothetical protein